MNATRKNISRFSFVFMAAVLVLTTVFSLAPDLDILFAKVNAVEVSTVSALSTYLNDSTTTDIYLTADLTVNQQLSVSSSAGGKAKTIYGQDHTITFTYSASNNVLIAESQSLTLRSTKVVFNIATY